MDVLTQRAGRQPGGLSNQEIRQITHLDRNQVKRLMTELREEGQAICPECGPEDALVPTVQGVRGEAG